MVAPLPHLAAQLTPTNCGLDNGAISLQIDQGAAPYITVSYTHLRAHETVLDLVCRLLLENKQQPSAHNLSRL